MRDNENVIDCIDTMQTIVRDFDSIVRTWERSLNGKRGRRPAMLTTLRSAVDKARSEANESELTTLRSVVEDC